MMEDLIKEYWGLCASSPTGLVWIKQQKKGPRLLGKPAGQSIAHGYLYGMLCGHNVRTHRALFLLTHGYLPATIDHIDGNTLNNSIANLRDVSSFENQHNRIAKGYCFDKGKWKAVIMVNGKNNHLGVFDTPEEARTAYLTAKKQLHPTAPERCYA